MPCLPSFWLSQRSLEGISPVCSTLPRGSGIFCTREVLSQPQPLLTQGLHTSHHGLGSAFQQCLGSQISSKPFPGIAALPRGSLNPALLPNPTWLLGRVDGMCMSPSGVWRGAGDGDGHWDLSQHCRAVLEWQWLYLQCQGTHRLLQHQSKDTAPPDCSCSLSKLGLDSPTSHLKHSNLPGHTFPGLALLPTGVMSEPGSAPAPEGHGPSQHWVGHGINCLCAPGLGSSCQLPASHGQGFCSSC